MGSVNEEVHQLIGGRIVGQPIYIQIKRSDDGTASNRRYFFVLDVTIVLLLNNGLHFTQMILQSKARFLNG